MRPDQISDSPIANKDATRPRKRGSWVVWVALLCMLLGAGYVLSQRSKPAAPSGRAASGRAGGGRGGRDGGGPIPVSVDKVKQGDMGVYINALGTVTPVYTVNVTSRVPGQLMQINYKEGQIVHKGDLLAVVDPRPYQAVVTQAEGQLARDQAQLKNAYIDLDRYKGIYAQKAIPEQTLATQQATVEQDQGTVKTDQGSLDAARVNYDYTHITSPIDGRIGLRPVDPGNIIQAGSQTLLTITQLQPITVIFAMAEDYISDVTSQLRAGRTLRVDALDRNNQTNLAAGTLLTVDNQVDTATGTVRARATFTNRKYELFPNEFVNARLLVKMLRSVNLIPTAAVQRNNDLAFVYVVGEGNAVQTRNIKIAAQDGTTAAVTGVRPGETLVTDGFDKLQDGSKVSVRRVGVPDTEEPNAQTGEAGKTDTSKGSSAAKGPR